MTFENRAEPIFAAIKPVSEADQARKALSRCLEAAGEEKLQSRLTGPLEIAEILVKDLYPGGGPVAALFLKTALENHWIQPAEVERDFGSSVQGLILGLQKIDGLDKRKTSTNVENFIRLLLTLSGDVRVILIQLAQQLKTLRRLEEIPSGERDRLMSEISLLYIPIAHRIGLHRVKTEFEERVMQHREPEQWKLIEQRLLETSSGREQYAREFIRPIAKVLHEHQFRCEIRSRVKSIPSISRKMAVQKVDFDKVYDLFAIRIILDNTIENAKADCWQVYSLVTDIYTPNPRRLRDWISFPKSNGYESLHTTVIGPEGRWVEVQIRTREMDEIAEKGLAAHWKYKTGTGALPPADLFATIREMLEKPGKKEDSRKMRDKQALYSDEIFIFTPKGDLKKLKAGYTVLDFAFEVHTEIGSTCTGAIVNGKMVPLKHVLQNGDTVRIMTSKTQKPNSGWLDIVKSPRNLARVKHALKMETYKESELGKEILKNKVLQLGFDFTDITINKLVQAFGCENYLDLYQKFGEGKLDPLKIKKAMAEKEEAPALPAKEETPHEQVSKVMTGKAEYLIIDNKEESYHYQFARCCHPTPGSKIFAFVSVAMGIRIHRTDCPNAKRLITRYPYRVMEARWK
ncbi:MAG TPA: TGS domain-containing protein [Bacteroidales bacterium]|nr:TGS domain-containing protein [Bacteroidales bacterium]